MRQPISISPGIFASRVAGRLAERLAGRLAGRVVGRVAGRVEGCCWRGVKRIFLFFGRWLAMKLKVDCVAVT